MAEGRRTVVGVRLSDADTARLDEVRGEVQRSEWAHAALLAALDEAGGPARPVPRKPERRPGRAAPAPAPEPPMSSLPPSAPAGRAPAARVPAGRYPCCPHCPHMHGGVGHDSPCGDCKAAR